MRFSGISASVCSVVPAAGFLLSFWKKSRLASIHKAAFPVFYFPLWISQMSRMLKMNAIR